MSHNEVLGANIPRASESIKQQSLDAGLIYMGDDNQLHVTEQKNSTASTDQS